MANNTNNDKSNTASGAGNEQKTYKQAAGEYYNRQYDNWVPWMEDKYLSWFTKDNKASYATKRSSLLPSLVTKSLTNPNPHLENLDKTKVTGVDQVDQVQDGVNGLVSGTMGQGGIAQPLGDAMSKEGINRAERGGKDEHGNKIESQGPLGGYGESAAEGVKGGVGSVAGGAKNAGGYVGGMFGGGKGEEKK
jgi:hypothetical protein